MKVPVLMEPLIFVNTIIIITYMITEARVPQFISVERHGAAALVTFRRPEVMNAWNTAMRRELVVAMEACEADAGVRAVVFTGEGPRAFGAGGDLKEPGPSRDEVSAWVGAWGHFYGTLRALSCPTIAALNGVAAGSSFQFALMADFRVAHAGVRMGQPEIRSGIPSSMGPWLIREMLGARLATDLCLSGRMMPGEECQRLGLFNRVVAPEEVVPEALRLAEELAAQPDLAFRLTKARLRALSEPGFQESLILWADMLRESLTPCG